MALAPPPPEGPALACPHFASCSGCTLDMLGPPPLMREARAFFEGECGLPAFPLHIGQPHGWRQRARLAVRCGVDGEPVIGLFEEGTHRPLAIPSCVVHHPAINRAVQLLQQGIAACGVQPYDEASCTGQLRYVQLTTAQLEQQPGAAEAAPPADGAAGASVAVVLVWNADAADGQADAALAALADWLWEAGRRPGGRGDALHSVAANFQPARGNAILGPGWRHLHGPAVTWARLGGADVALGSGSFMQANGAAMDACLAAMQRHVPPGSTVADLHAGVGTIGLSLAATRRPRWVRCVEINALCEAPFKLAAARLRQRLAAAADADGSAEQRGDAPAVPRLEYRVAAAGSNPGRWCAGASVVVCDPPRKGLEPELLAWLCGRRAAAAGTRRLLYLSCGFPALRRDAAALLASGRWRLAHAEGFMFFPGADHVETLAVFDAA